MTEAMTTKKPKKQKAPDLIPVELIDQLLAQVENKDAESILISTITDEVMDEVTQWQQRPLETMYPIVYFDALRLKVRDDGTVLGLWIEQTEGAKFWLKVFNELKNRGLDDVLIAVVDGLRGFPEAIEAVYPQAQIQTCIVHLIRNSTTLASWQDRKGLAALLKPVYHAPNAEAAEAELDAFAAGSWGAAHQLATPRRRAPSFPSRVLH